jgi:hypothetical protein
MSPLKELTIIEISSPVSVGKAPAAALVQWVPQLIGLCHAGCRCVQTPISTSATTGQPTEQCVQTFFSNLGRDPGPQCRPTQAGATATEAT